MRPKGQKEPFTTSIEPKDLTVLEQHLHITNSALLRELLLRRIKRLESDQLPLKGKIFELEQRLAQSPSSKRSPVVLSTLLAEATQAVRILSEQVQTDIDFTRKITPHKQQQLHRQLKALRREGWRLNQLIDEAIEGIRAISEQIQTWSSLLMKDIRLSQEKMTAHLYNLYNQDGQLALTLTEAKDVALSVRKQARLKQNRIQREALEEREKLLVKIESLQEQSNQLQVALTRATNAANCILHWMQIDNAQKTNDLDRIKKEWGNQ